MGPEYEGYSFYRFFFGFFFTKHILIKVQMVN